MENLNQVLSNSNAPLRDTSVEKSSKLSSTNINEFALNEIKEHESPLSNANARGSNTKCNKLITTLVKNVKAQTHYKVDQVIMPINDFNQ